MYRRDADALRVLLVHPGGPFWKKRDDGAWSIPKGEIERDEDEESAARREFREELGSDCGGVAVPLGDVVQSGGKRVVAFAVEGEFDPTTLNSNTFDIEWPPRSGRHQSFPEVDRAEWMTLTQARKKIIA